jgi:hypothetical protein
MNTLNSAFVLVTLSRHRCADLGQIVGTHRIAMHKAARKMARARKGYQFHLQPLDARLRVHGDPILLWPKGGAS